jgi:hypothetical protein
VTAIIINSSSSQDSSSSISSCSSRSSSRQSAWVWHLGASPGGSSRHSAATTPPSGAHHHHQQQQPISIPSAGPSVAQQQPHSKHQKQRSSIRQCLCRQISWLHGRALRCCTGRGLSQGCTGRTPCSRSQCRSCRCKCHHRARIGSLLHVSKG